MWWPSDWQGAGPDVAYEFGRGLSFPDIYQLTFVGAELRRVERLWDAGCPALAADGTWPRAQ